MLSPIRVSDGRYPVLGTSKTMLATPPTIDTSETWSATVSGVRPTTRPVPAIYTPPTGWRPTSTVAPLRDDATWSSAGAGVAVGATVGKAVGVRPTVAVGSTVVVPPPPQARRTSRVRSARASLPIIRRECITACSFPASSAETSPYEVWCGVIEQGCGCVTRVRPHAEKTPRRRRRARDRDSLAKDEGPRHEESHRGAIYLFTLPPPGGAARTVDP